MGAGSQPSTSRTEPTSRAVALRAAPTDPPSSRQLQRAHTVAEGNRHSGTQRCAHRAGELGRGQTGCHRGSLGSPSTRSPRMLR